MKTLSRWRVPFILLALALLLAGCATTAYDKRKSEETRDLGEKFLRANQSSRALHEFLKALELNPEDPYLHYDLALAYDMKGAADKAEVHLKEAIRLKPDYSDAYNYLGFIYFRNGEVDRAIVSYKKALSNLLYLRPQDAHLNLGVAYLSRKEYNKAVEHLQKAIKLVPDYADAYNSLGQAYEGLQRYSEARRSYEKAVEFNPNYPRAYLNLGKLLIRVDDRLAAVKSLNQVMKLAPDSDMAREARLYLNQLK